MLLCVGSASRIDNVITFLSNPSVSTFALILGSDPWYIIAPYLGGYVMMIAYTQYIANKNTFDLIGIDQNYIYQMAMKEIYSSYMKIWGWRATEPAN